jgi:hypothetical protein
LKAAGDQSVSEAAPSTGCQSNRTPTSSDNAEVRKDQTKDDTLGAKNMPTIPTAPLIRKSQPT